MATSYILPLARARTIRDVSFYDHEIYDNEEKDITDMRADRLSPLTKPRTISRGQSCVGENGVRESHENHHESPANFDAQQCFDLTREDLYSLAALKPVQSKKFLNLEAYPYAFEGDEDTLIWATAMLSESPAGHALLIKAGEAGWQFTLSDLGTSGYHLNIEDKIMELDHYGLDAPSLGRSSFFRNSFLCVLAKALRDIWQEEHWGNFEERYKPQAVLLLERARAADCDSLAIMIGWELRSAGYSDVWRHILGSDDGDMAQVLLNILERYPTALYNGTALAHVFRQWYADTARVDALDHATLEQMDTDIHAAQESGLGFIEIVDGDDSNDIIEKKSHPDPKIFEGLATLPDDSTYLKDLGETVAKDPFFCSLNDPINQAHLFQIVYDSEVTYVDDIPFRDARLARKFMFLD
ncbi:MAG: hypothetical protein MRY79_00395 [Alphaproteobacteria bacterium]|nr:hypothetical protein [Alphaproteobacteria bacterium]